MYRHFCHPIGHPEQLWHNKGEDYTNGAPRRWGALGATLDSGYHNIIGITSFSLLECRAIMKDWRE